ncbi:MAG: hypothetical protein HPY44_17660 [Armatimonadetes bacterium]|nr:hypothetical protein [Armatimonadota bacterium]
MNNSRGWLFTLALAAVTATAGADTCVPPGAGFSFDVDGNWTMKQADQTYFWESEDPGRAGLILSVTPVPLDGSKALGPQVIERVKAMPEMFAQASNFSTMQVPVAGVPRVGVAFRYVLGGRAQVARMVVIPSRERHWVLNVDGPADMPGLEQFTLRLLATLREISELPAESGAWQVIDHPRGPGLLIFEKRQGGGQVEVLAFAPGNARARRLLRERLKPAQDPSFRLIQWNAAADDTLATCSYTIQVDGTAMQGEALVSLGEQSGTFVNMLAPQWEFGALAPRMKALLREACAPRRAGLDEVSNIPLQRQKNIDGTAWMSVPAGWRVEGTGGSVATKGREGVLLVGNYGTMISTAAAGQMAALGLDLEARGFMIGDFAPAQYALPVILPAIARRSGEAITDVRVLEAAPLPGSPGYWRVLASYVWQVPGQPASQMEGIAFISTTNTGDNWMFTLTFLTWPAGSDRVGLPLLARMYATYGVSQNLLDARIAHALASQEECRRIIDEVIKERNAASESAAKKWDRYIRGTEPLRDEDTGEIRDVSSLEDIMRWAEDNPTLRELNTLTEEQWRHELP